MKKCILVMVFLSGCYYGPGVTRQETNAVRRSVRDLNPVPVLNQQSNAIGQGVIAPILDRTLTPLFLGTDEYEDPERIRARDYDENMRRQQKAMDEMDRELEELNR